MSWLGFCRKDGKTVCKDTFAGYTCTCGSGFVSHKDPKSNEEVITSLHVPCTLKRFPTHIPQGILVHGA